MIRIEYSYTNYNELFRDLVRTLHLTVKNNVGILPASLGDGYVELVHLHNGLQLVVFDYVLKENILYHRKKTNQAFYAIRIDEAAEQKEDIKSALFFSHVSNEWFYMAPSNMRLRNIHILFSEAWLKELLINEPKGEDLMASVLRNAPLYHYEMLDSEYRRLMSDIMTAKSEPAFNKFTVHTRIMLIIERFFCRYYRKTSESNRFIRASSDEMQRLKMVEAELLKDFSFTPPNINQLSRMAAMSPSKLKQLFKDVFGMPVYKYYQKHRLQRGKAMLITKKHTLKEIASELGYTHVKDFSKAFQKQFDQLPGELIN